MSKDTGLKVVSSIGSFDAKIENLSGKAEPRKINGKEIEMKPDGTPKVYYKNTKGDDLSFCRVRNGQPLVDSNGASEKLSNGYVDPSGSLVHDVLPYFKTYDGDLIPAVKNEKTDVFEVKKWEPISNFTDKYIVDKYYQVKPGQGKSKKDYQKLACVNANTRGMKDLFDYMTKNQVVGRGVLNITSAGYLPTIAYLRAVQVGNTHWTLEIGVFKQQKRFTWVEEIDFTPREVEVEHEAVPTPSIDEI